MSYYPNQYQSGYSEYNNGNNEQMFPVIPANQSYLAGQTRHIQFSPNPRAVFSVGVILFIIGLVALAFGIHQWFDIQNLEKNGVATQAIVTNHRTSTSRSSTTYYVTYSFTLADSGWNTGQTFTKELSVSRDFYREHAKGSAIQILYLPADPNDSEIPNQVFPLGFIFAGIFLGITLIMGILTVWNLRLNRLLEQKGLLIPAQVVSVNPVRMKNRRSLRLRYSFTTPDGQTITRTRSLVYNAYTTNISPYTRLGVLYYDKHHYRLL